MDCTSIYWGKCLAYRRPEGLSPPGSFVAPKCPLIVARVTGGVSQLARSEVTRVMGSGHRNPPSKPWYCAEAVAGRP
jgi:hypothetical protein